MKRCLLFIALFGFIYQLAARAEITEVTVSNDYPVVTRVVIALSEPTTWTHSIDTEYHQISLVIKRCSVTNIDKQGLSANKLISGLDLAADSTGVKVLISLNGPFILETMTTDQPFKIVLDIFAYKKNYTFLEFLWMSKFYEDTGQLVKASKQYAEMMQKYPGDTPGYYYWGNLLVQRGRPETAKQKLRLVAQGSKYYPAAQNLLARLENRLLPAAENLPPVQSEPPKKTPKPTPPQKTEVKPAPEPEPVPVAEEPAPSDSMAMESTSTVKNPEPLFNRPKEAKMSFLSFTSFFGMSFKEFLQTKFMHSVRALPFWFWVIVVVVLAIIVLIIIDHKRRRFYHKKAAHAKQKHQQTNDAVKQGMVIKLLENNWSEHEIARELLLTSREAHMYVSQGKKIMKRKASRSE